MTEVDYTTLFERPYHLRLERESDRHWIVIEASSPNQPMIRTPSWDTAVRFMEAFCAKEQGATFALPEREDIGPDGGDAHRFVAAPSVPGASRSESATEHSWRVAQDATSHDRLAVVYRIRPHEPLDESA